MSILLRVCPCGRALDIAAWSGLQQEARGVDNGVEYIARRCSCGNVLRVTLSEDDCAAEIATCRFRMHAFYAHALLELAHMRIARPERREIFLMQARGHRVTARAARNRAHELERMLLSIFRARELRNPRKRLGRNLVIVGSAQSPTEPQAGSGHHVPGQGRESPTSGVDTGDISRASRAPCSDVGAPHGVDGKGAG